MGIPGFTKGRSGFGAFRGVGIFGGKPITSLIGGILPVLIATPTISVFGGGAMSSGSLLICDDGNWTNSPFDFYRSWDRRLAGSSDPWVKINVYTQSYTLRDVDVGYEFRCRVLGVNDFGAALLPVGGAISNVLGPVVAAVGTAARAIVPYDNARGANAGTLVAGQAITIDLQYMTNGWTLALTDLPAGLALSGSQITGTPTKTSGVTMVTFTQSKAGQADFVSYWVFMHDTVNWAPLREPTFTGGVNSDGGVLGWANQSALSSKSLRRVLSSSGTDVFSAALFNDNAGWIGDSNGSGKYRSEIELSADYRARVGERVYFAFRSYFEGMVPPDAASGNQYQIIGQCHHVPEAGDAFVAPPLVFTRVKDGSGNVFMRVITRSTIVRHPANSDLVTVTRIENIPMPNDAWHDWNGYYKMGPDGTGELYLVVNGTVVLNLTGIALGYSEPDRLDKDGLPFKVYYWKMGLYVAPRPIATLSAIHKFEPILGKTAIPGLVGRPRTPFTVPIDLNGYYFAASRLRENQGESAALDDTNRFRVDRAEFWSPPYPTNNFRVPLPGYRTTTAPDYDATADTSPSERALSNAYNVEAVYLHRFVSGAWESKLVPNSAVTVQPGVGVLLPDCVFDTPTPANTRMMVSIASNVASGAKFMGGMSPSSATGRLEGCRWASSSQLAQASGTAALTGTDGRIGGGIFCPPWIVAKATGGLDRPVVLIHGDSKAYGKNYFEAYNASKYLSMGPMAAALDDDVSAGSRRISYANIAIPSIGVEQRFRANWSRKLDLIRLVPNRPYTHITCNSYNNGWLATYNGEDSRAAFNRYYNILKAESQAWNNNPAPIWQERPIPRPNSWGTTLAGQNPAALTSDPWAQFEPDLLANFYPQLAGCIDVARDYAHDRGANRNKLKVSPKTFTLAADYAASATTISLVEQPAVGDALIIDDNKSNGGAYVRVVSGTGPYTVTIYQGVPTARTAGFVIPTSYAFDSQGLHPSNLGGDAQRAVINEWKASALAAVPA